MYKKMNILICIILLLVSLMFLIILHTYIRLYRFKKCYDSNFTLPYCEKYKDF